MSAIGSIFGSEGGGATDDQRQSPVPASCWTALPVSEFPVSLSPRARSYDIVIVGAGITGALMAEALTDGGKKVLVVDRRHPVGAGAAASLALIRHETDVPLSRLAETIGAERAERAWHRSATAVERIISLVSRLSIDCSLQRKKTLYMSGGLLDASQLAAEAQARNLTGIKAQFLSRDCLLSQYGIDRDAALLSTMSASLNPLQLNAGLLREVCRRGAEVAGGVEIIDVRHSGGRMHLLTSGGDFLSASQVVFCTGTECPDFLPVPEQALSSTWAIATEPGLDLPHWLHNHLLWEASEPYLHLRTTPDGRLLGGGEDEQGPGALHSAEKQAEKCRNIADKLSRLLGRDVGRLDYQWSGAYGKTRTGLPYIGKVPGMPQVYAAMGFGGNGLTFAQIASEIVQREMAGRQDHDADLFAFPSLDPSHGRDPATDRLHA